MQPLIPKSTLISQIGGQSTHFFKALGLGIDWLSEPLETWTEIPAYLKLHKFAHHLPVSNEATERMIKRTYDYQNYGGKSEADYQVTLHAVGAAVAKVPDRKSKKALIQAYGQMN